MSSKPHHHHPTHWILDWDGTITKNDTLDTLVHIAATAKPNFPTQDHWRRVSQAYMNDYSATIEKLAPNGHLPQSFEDEKRLLAQLKAVEQRSLDRVSSSSIFAGLSRKALEEGAWQAIASRRVEIRNGFAAFFQHIQVRERDRISILSVNWSRHFIRSCLDACGINLPFASTLSNELDKIDSGEPSTGLIVPATGADGTSIISSGDKLERLKDMRRENERIVYVGDSWTDIECLFAADVGICIRDECLGSGQKKLAKALERLGAVCPRLKDWEGADQCGVPWATDFGEIRDWMESRPSQQQSAK
ncbi:hypothetical protein BDW02DRAFT_501923 [Decorospora gaudefroyi]|uniref:HAD-like protein n=1 Tax=Decorospora gaudefroyi TaxID=184978 RepID=A0A6A5K5C8_9PLEO|nr:hypothetical protein BDW02DRAFT_501923 [Decorospora gaudefroyi]